VLIDARHLFLPSALNPRPDSYDAVLLENISAAIDGTASRAKLSRPGGIDGLNPEAGAADVNEVEGWLAYLGRFGLWTISVETTSRCVTLQLQFTGSR
jgi:hypothetical protein